MNKNILIGICGIGFGHCIREKVIIDYLLKKKHNIHLFTYNTSTSFFSKLYPEIPNSKVIVPWIVCNKNGMCFKSTSLHFQNQNTNIIKHNFKVMDQAFNSLRENPHLVISDYEPISAQFAYANNIPLITLEQQSKFLGYRTHPINDEYRAFEEISRLNFFFPKASMRVSSSLFSMKSYEKSSFDIKIIGPILRDEIIRNNVYNNSDKRKDFRKILVYLSPTLNKSISLAKVFDIFSNLKNYHFTISIYDSGEVKSNFKSENITIMKFSQHKFIDELVGSDAVICTAGFQIISECVYLGKPIYCIPNCTYEQQFNAAEIESYGLGVNCNSITKKDLQYFFMNLDSFKKNNDTHRLTSMLPIGNNELLNILSEEYEL